MQDDVMMVMMNTCALIVFRTLIYLSLTVLSDIECVAIEHCRVLVHKKKIKFDFVTIN